jgi:hypothetical protein
MLYNVQCTMYNPPKCTVRYYLVFLPPYHVFGILFVCMTLSCLNYNTQSS